MNEVKEKLENTLDELELEKERCQNLEQELEANKDKADGFDEYEIELKKKIRELEIQVKRRVSPSRLKELETQQKEKVPTDDKEV